MRPRRRPRPAGSPLAGDATGTMPSARELLSLRDGKDQRGARVRVCSVADALAGEGGVPAYAAVENEGGRAFATLHRSGDGEVERMQMSCLEVVDFGAHRVLVVPKNLDPSDLTIEDLRILELEDAVLFWEMVGRERQATYRDVSNGKPASLRLRPCAKQQRSAERRSDSLWTRLPPIPEVFCAEAQKIAVPKLQPPGLPRHSVHMGGALGARVAQVASSTTALPQLTRRQETKGIYD